MFILDSKKEAEKIFIINTKKQYENDPFLTQEEIDILVQKLNAVLK